MLFNLHGDKTGTAHHIKTPAWPFKCLSSAERGAILSVHCPSPGSLEPSALPSLASLGRRFCSAWDLLQRTQLLFSMQLSIYMAGAFLKRIDDGKHLAFALVPSALFYVLGKVCRREDARTRLQMKWHFIPVSTLRAGRCGGPDEVDGQTVAVLQGTALSCEGHPPPKFPEQPLRRDRLVTNPVRCRMAVCVHTPVRFPLSLLLLLSGAHCVPLIHGLGWGSKAKAAQVRGSVELPIFGKGNPGRGGGRASENK